MMTAVYILALAVCFAFGAKFGHAYAINSEKADKATLVRVIREEVGYEAMQRIIAKVLDEVEPGR